MPQNQTITPTQRAYTLRLRGATKDDNSWRDAIWKTHVAVNKGAKVFGDWLLTLRGGLDHNLASDSFGKKTPSETEIRNRKILLALSWLSVESREGAPADYIIPATDTEDTLKEILHGRGVIGKDADEWVAMAAPSLTAAIRDDAVWVNRSKAFDSFAKKMPSGFDRTSASAVIFGFFGKPEAYFFIEAANTSDGDEPGAEEKPPTGKDVDEPADFSNTARSWLSANWGSGEKADTEHVVGTLQRIGKTDLTSFDGDEPEALLRFLVTCCNGQIDPTTDKVTLLKTIGKLIGWKGAPSMGRKALEKVAESRQVTQELIDNLQDKFLSEATDKSEDIGKVIPEWIRQLRPQIEGAIGITFRAPTSDDRERDLIGEYSVLLDHAARRVSIAHSWIKWAEAERQRFEDDAMKKNNIPSAVRDWLDDFCQKRSQTSGAENQYLIRKRALEGWKEIVAAWSTQSCKTRDDRVQRAREKQDELDKFGDINLFERLADDDARVVWESGPDHLINYSAAQVAGHNQQRFKVPAYRHPEPLKHPVFCDFGNSRWSISFDIHEAVKKATKSAAKPAKKKASSNAEVTGEIPSTDDRTLLLGLWNGNSVGDRQLRFASKRLQWDITSPLPNAGEKTEVVRADRFGRAATGAAITESVLAKSIFEQDYWNGRLQAPRAQLDRLAHYLERKGLDWTEESRWDGKARALRDRINWLITFSAKLTPQKGPWLEYADANGLKLYSKPSDDGAYPFSRPGQDKQEKRGSMARLVLCRLPDLRVLSVDLGHRFGAVCAVWHTLSGEQFQRECKAARNEGAEVTVRDLYCHIKFPKKKSNNPSKKQQKEGKDDFHPIRIYRRIGGDLLPDGSPHPAPWARLERQFTIKLQGEDRKTRRATADEMNRVRNFEAEIGLVRRADEKLPIRVDELISQTVRNGRLALQRHGRRAKIAWGFLTDEQHLPGGRFAPLTADARKELYENTLRDWADLATDSRWRDTASRELWEIHVQIHLKDPQVEETRQGREDRLASMKDGIASVAQKLVTDASLRSKLHQVWATRWHTDNKNWKERLRWLHDWILPRGIRKERKDKLKMVRGMGGLSVERINSIKALYQIQKAYRTRPEPGDPRKNVPQKGDNSLNKFGQSILDTLEELRTQRVKQLASRIVEAALGIGIEPKIKGPKDVRRPRERIKDSRFVPCHAVVIENLQNYRPDELQTRRENRMLMSWASAKVRKALQDHCYLYGLHLREVSPNYTSRQDSRTGAPGVRCTDVSVHDFLTSPLWRKAVSRAKENIGKGNTGSELDRYLEGLDNSLQKEWGSKSREERNQARPVRIPRKGGDLFVSADKDSPAAKGLQADLNAAANIGLRALLDPDWPGAWWYVPCDPKTNIPVKEKVLGSVAFADSKLPLVPVQEESESAKSKRGRTRGAKEKTVINWWRDLSAEPVGPGNGWKNYGEYQNRTQFRVVQNLRTHSKDN